MDMKKTVQDYIYVVGAITIGIAAGKLVYNVTKPIVNAIAKKVNHKEEA